MVPGVEGDGMGWLWTLEVAADWPRCGSAREFCVWGGWPGAVVGCMGSNMLVVEVN